MANSPNLDLSGYGLRWVIESLVAEYASAEQEKPETHAKPDRGLVSHFARVGRSGAVGHNS